MKSATMSPLSVTADLRREAESVLKEGETLSSFVESSLREQVEQRKAQRDFIARALAARDRAKTNGRYVSKEEVMDSLRAIRDKVQTNQ